MTQLAKRETLQRQLAETKKLLSLVADHPVMSQELKEKIHELEEEIFKIPQAAADPSTTLYFWGGPVVGSIGIDAVFAGQIIKPFQNMVAADFSQRHREAVARKGRRRGEKDSRLLLTALPRGSFGLKLSRAESNELFEDSELSDTLVHVTQLIDSAKSEKRLEDNLSHFSIRVVSGLKEFLNVLSRSKAGLRMETGNLRFELSPEEALQAFDRVSGVSRTEQRVEIKGIFNGILTNSLKFEFHDSNNYKITGAAADGVTPEMIENWNVTLTNKEVLGVFVRSTVRFQSGKERTYYVLKSMRLLVEGESLRESWDGKIELSLKWASGWWHLSKTGDDYSSPVARSKGAAVRRAFKLIGQNPGTLTVYRQDGSVEEGYQKPAGEAPDFHASSKFTGTVKPHTRSSELLSVDKEGAYVALSEPVEIDYWIKAFDCTKEQLQAAVEKVGNKVEDVKNEINRDRQ